MLLFLLKFITFQNVCFLSIFDPRRFNSFRRLFLLSGCLKVYIVQCITKTCKKYKKTLANLQKRRIICNNESKGR